MFKINKKMFCTGVYFLGLFLVGLFFTANNVFAALEVTYPSINGVSLTTNPQFTEYLIYIFNAATFIGFFAVFLSLLVAGAMYIVSTASAQLRADAKDRVTGAISGLIILACVYLIVITINPQLSILNLDQLQQVAPAQPSDTPPGAYFYNDSSCATTSVQTSTIDVPDLIASGGLINSVALVQSSTDSTKYMSILYSKTNFQGKCQVLNPTASCQTTSIPIVSASVFGYDSSPNGDGVYFFRKSSLDSQIAWSGGYYKVNNSEIANKYTGDLNKLTFTGSSSGGDCTVPKNQRDCTEYDKNGNCTKKTCPTLGGDNISSILISGNYLVLFVYKSPKDSNSGPWTSCEAFPTPDDVNKNGPRQIKWEEIRNNKGVIPNYVLIFPVKQK